MSPLAPLVTPWHRNPLSISESASDDATFYYDLPVSWVFCLFRHENKGAVCARLDVGLDMRVAASKTTLRIKRLVEEKHEHPSTLLDR